MIMRQISRWMSIQVFASSGLQYPNWLKICHAMPYVFWKTCSGFHYRTLNGSGQGVDSFSDVEKIEESFRIMRVKEVSQNLKAIRLMLQIQFQDLQIDENNSNKGNEKNKDKEKSKAKKNKKKGKGKK